jgi:cytidyltransferase-like protein
MKFREFITEAKTGKVIVVYGGGFQPFHAGHISSYEQAKRAFPSADFYVASSNDVKQRPIPFKDKQFLAQQAGVTDAFVQVSQPVNPQEILTKYNPDKDILILVRSERDPVNYTKKDGSSAYYQPFKSLKDCKPFNPKKDGHGYVFVTKKKVFSIGGKEIFSGSQVRSMYSKGDDIERRDMIRDLYPKAKSPLKVKTLLDKYIGGVNEEVDLDEAVQHIISEGVHDKSIFKAVFLAGGPGSGKDYVLDNTLAGHGLTELNSDKALEFLMDKSGLDKTMPASETEKRDIVRGKAKSLTDLRQRLALLGRNGLIINGTGDDVEKIKKIKARLEEIGYDTHIIVVNTADEISAQRNVERGQRGGRTVPEKIRKQKWDAVQNARPELAKIFGDNYVEFDNSEDLRQAPPEVVKAKKDEMLNVFKKIKAFTSAPPKSPESQLWIASEMSKKDKLGVPKSGEGTQLAPHPDSGAAEEAKKLGLSYFGFGRWGKEGVVTHHSVHDSLVPIEKEKIGQKTLKIAAPGQSKTTNSTINKVQMNPTKVNEDFENFLTEAVAITVEAEETFDIHQEEKKQELHHNQLLKSSNGKVKTFMLRRAAAKEAHINGGVVHKQGAGYVIKIKESEDVSSINQPIQEATTGRSTVQSGSTTSTRSLVPESGDSSCDCGTCSSCGTEGTRQKKSVTEAKKLWQKKVSTEAIDAGTEAGMSLSGASKEKLDKNGKVTMTELTGDETTLSIGDQKEDELKKVGINLSTFKAKKFV